MKGLEPMTEYIVKYITTEAHIVSLHVSTYSAMQAQSFAEGMPKYNGIVSIESPSWYVNRI